MNDATADQWHNASAWREWPLLEQWYYIGRRAGLKGWDANPPAPQPDDNGAFYLAYLAGHGEGLADRKAAAAINEKGTP